MSVQTIYRAQVGFDLTGDDDYHQRMEDALTELHGLAVGSLSCESTGGNPACDPYVTAEFATEHEARRVEQEWIMALGRRGAKVSA